MTKKINSNKKEEENNPKPRIDLRCFSGLHNYGGGNKCVRCGKKK